jgi:hypothetical protein
MNVIENAFLNAVNIGAEYLSFQGARLIFTVLLAGSGLSKFAPAQLQIFFPTIPDWFYPIAGIWEIIIAYTMYVGNYDVAFPMTNSFFGGAIYITVILNYKTIWMLPMAIGTLVLTGIIGKYSSIAPFPHMWYELGAGFVTGFIVSGPLGKKIKVN